MLPFSALWCAERARKIMERRAVSPPKIITTHNHPPIPQRCFDWSARYENYEEGPYGWGDSEAEAVRDLTENCEAPEGE